MKISLRNRISFLLGCALLAVSLTACAQAASGSDKSKDGLTIVTSFYPMYDFARKVAGDKAIIKNLVPPGSEPHDWEPTPSDMVLISEADILIYNGAGMELWVDDVLSAIDSSKLQVVNTSEKITLRPAEQHDEEEADEDEHGAYDPHVWLNPMYAKEQMRAIFDALVKADPANESYYTDNFDKYAAEFDRLDQEFSAALKNIENPNIVVAHEAFGYLCDQYGLTQVGIEGVAADSEPDAARMAEIITFVEEKDVRVIFFEQLVNPKVAEAIAADTGATTDVLNPLGGLTQEQIDAGEDYFSIQRQNLAALVRATGPAE